MVIGNSIYLVTTHFKSDGRETAEDKLVRLISDRAFDKEKTEKNSEIAAEIPCYV
jgi:hypothetical protein